MPTLANFTTPGVTIPYLTVVEFRAAVTADDVSNLVPGDTQAAQDEALAQKIWQASSWANLYCNQDLAATVNVEHRRVSSSRDGEMIVNTKYWPILEIRDVQIGSAPNMYTPMTDLSGIQIDLKQFTVTPTWGSGISSGPLQFGATPGYGSGRLFVRYSYVNGWPTTTLAASCLLGASSVQVADATGIYGGTAAIQASLTTPPATILTVYDGASTENLSVAAVTGTGPYTLTLNGVTQFAHTLPSPAGPSAPAQQLSALPPAIKDAIVMLTSSLIRERGTEAMVIPEMGTNPGHMIARGALGEEADVAFELLAPFRAPF